MVSALEEPHCCLVEEGWGRTGTGNLDHNPGGKRSAGEGTGAVALLKQGRGESRGALSSEV